MAHTAKRVREIFLAAIEVADPAERSALLDRECAADLELRRRVETLLRADLDPASILQEPVAGLSDDPPSDDTIGLEPTPDSAPSSRTQADSGTRHEAHLLTFLSPSTQPGSLGRLGHYEIQEVIGRGGFGIVLRAFDEKLHRAVAIKVLAPSYAAIGSARARFIREARTAAAIKNEHVVAIHAVEDEAQPPYLVMEIIDGISLQDKIDKKGPLPVTEILRIGLQMAEGLAAAHKHGFMHRDIKPANILLENGVERVKITDFGLARAVDDASVTQSGTIAGTPMYMSPEQAEGLPIDHRSDLFSLGTVLYAMCTGHPAFRASGTHAVLKRVIDATPRPIRETNNEVPDWLCDIIGKLHAKKPVDRFQTAREVAELLGARLADVQAGRAGSVAPETVASTSMAQAPGALLEGGAGRSTAPRRKRLAVVAVLLLLTCVGIAAWLLWPVPTGTLVVDVDSDPARLGPSVLVRVTKAAAEVREASDRNWMENSWGGRAFDLRPGLYVVQVYYMDKKYGLDTYSAEVTINAGQVATVKVPTEFFTKAKAGTPAEAKDWVQLFNGKDLTGWKTHPEQPGDWSVVDGVLIGKSKRSHLFSERGDFENFHLRVQAKINKGGNSGIYFHATYGFDFDMRQIKGGDGRLPFGYEVEFASTSYAGTQIAGSVIRLSSKDALHKAKTPPIADDTWSTIEIIARGNRVETKINGATATDFEDVGKPFRKGHFALQCLYSTVVHFKKIEIKELPPEKPGWVQLFNGKDLTGWKLLDKSVWTVEGDELVGRGKGYSILLTQRDDFGNFHLRGQAKVLATDETGPGQAGVWLRLDNTKDKELAGYKAQWSTTAGKTGVLLVRDKASDPPALLSKEVAASIPADTWFDFEIIANGANITVKVNDVVTAQSTDERYRRGWIALERWANGEVHFKKIEIKELPPAKAALPTP